MFGASHPSEVIYFTRHQAIISHIASEGYIIIDIKLHNIEKLL